MRSIVGDAVGPGIDCWGIGIKRKRTNQTSSETLLKQFHVPHPTYIPTTRSFIVAKLVRADTRSGRSLGHVSEQ